MAGSKEAAKRRSRSSSTPLIAAMILLLPLITLSALASGFIRGSEITPETVLAQMNFYRGLNGARPLRIDARLTLAAEDRMRDMTEQGFWSHNAPDGSGPFVWLRTRGYFHAMAGENLASGFETAEILVSSWMESPGHRRNIVTPGFSDVGIAIIEGMPTKRATGRSVVVIFARERVEFINTAGSKGRPPETSAESLPPDSQR
jgi:hypothetical protein